MALLKSMRNTALENTELGTMTAMLWEEIEDVIIEVWADAASIEYVAKCDDDIFVTEDINELNELLVWHFN